MGCGLRADPQREPTRASRRICEPRSRLTRAPAKPSRPSAVVNLFALAFRTNNMKTPAGRAKKIAALVEMLARRETIVPEPPKTTKDKPSATAAPRGRTTSRRPSR